MIKSAVNKISYILPILLFFNACINAAFTEEASPQDVVKKYYTEDLNGARLSGETYKNIKPLVTWEQEPGWDHAFIADQVKIHNARKISKTEALFEVRYHVIGVVEGDNLLEYDFIEVIDFILIYEEEKWKIKKPIFPPHILPSTAIRYLEELIRSEGTEDKIRSKNLRHTIERLKEKAK